MAKKIIVFVGSKRERSFNQQLANVVQEMIADRAQVEQLDFFDVPFFDQDTEFPTPASVQRVREQVARADGLWVICPEYNGSYPAVVKNLFDWLSRPIAAGGTERVITGKKVTVAAAGGKFATAGLRRNLVELLEFIGAQVYGEQGTGIALSPESWGSGDLQLTAESTQLLQAQVDGFLAFLNE